MPRSIFMGRPWPHPGEPLFLKEDTDAALALAAEEADTCPSCGMPKSYCRAKYTGVQFTDFDVTEETCQATLRLARHRESDEWKKRHAATQQATQLSVRPRDGYVLDFTAGLDLLTEDDGQHSDPQDREQHNLHAVQLP